MVADPFEGLPENLIPSAEAREGIEDLGKEARTFARKFAAMRYVADAEGLFARVKSAFDQLAATEKTIDQAKDALHVVLDQTAAAVAEHDEAVAKLAEVKAEAARAHSDLAADAEAVVAQAKASAERAAAEIASTAEVNGRVAAAKAMDEVKRIEGEAKVKQSQLDSLTAACEAEEARLASIKQEVERFRAAAAKL